MHRVTGVWFSSLLRCLSITTVLVALVAVLAPSVAAAVSFARQAFPAEPGMLSVAVGNFNGDSAPDLAVANESSNNVSILLGNGSGGFTGPTNFAAGSTPIGVAVGDFNGDSHPDLAVAN